MIINKIDSLPVLELFPVEIVEGKLKVSLKNGSTLLLTPEVEEAVVTGYTIEYLTGKENKSIEKIEKKIKDLEVQVVNIRSNGGADIESEDVESENETVETVETVEINKDTEMNENNKVEDLDEQS